MPPKAATKQTVQKAKAKVVEDKTFGLKNKNKSAKVQKYVASVEKQVEMSGQNQKTKAREDALALKKQQEREEKLARDKELQELFKQAVSVKQVEVAPGVDPKSLVCEFFKKGLCTKGNKCKFAHDLAVGRKGEKIDLYSDRREETMENWDQSKLEEVVNAKQDGDNKNLPTDIICKHFIDAVEKKQYGWFWQCPNDKESGKCKYRHALPPGFVLKAKKDEEGEEEEEDQITMEEEIEEQRAKLTKLTPVTFETFMIWKAEQKRKREEADAAAELQRKADIKAGRAQMSGLELFEFNPNAFVDDDAADDTHYHAEEALDDEDEDRGNARKNNNNNNNNSNNNNGDGDDGGDDDDGEGEDEEDEGEDNDGDDNDDDNDDGAPGGSQIVDGVTVNSSLFINDDDDDD